MSQFTTFEEEVLVIKEKEKPYVIEYAPTNYISVEQEKTGMKEIPFQEPKSTNKSFGVVKPGNGLIIIEPGILEINLGKGLEVDPNSKKIILSADIYPQPGFNIELTKDQIGNFRYDVVGENELVSTSDRVPTSKATADYITSKVGNTSEINQELNTGTVVTTLNELYTRSTYKHKQMAPENIWLINHPLRKYPSVTIVTENKQVVVGDIEYISDSQVKVSFTSGFSGSAYLN